MNDYLTQLVTRNLGMANVVQLRPIALFAPERTIEPLGEIGAFVDAPAIEPVPAQPVHSSPPAEPAPRNALPTPAEPLPLLSEPANIHARQRPISADPVRLRTLPNDVAPPADVAPRRTPAAIAPLPSPQFTAPKEPPPVTVAPTVPVAAPQHTVIEQPTLAPMQRIVIDRVEPAQPPIAPTARDPQPQPGPLVMPQPSISVVQPARRASPPAVPAQLTVAAAEPTIHVTIGRIEVRATPPPSPAARPKSAPAPTTSLDDYLRERGGGRR